MDLKNSKLQAEAWLSHALCAPGQHTAKREENARDSHVFACKCQIFTDFNFFDS